jgi:hypothetical protein
MLPNLIVIGAMKAGTTSLHHYLSLHPEIFMSDDKEPSFFTVEKNWHRGLPWYESLFATERPIRGEASPDYTKFPLIGGVPERIHSVLPNTKMIYLVREPIERIVSHYIDAYSFGRVHKPLNRELADFESHHFVNCSRYHMQLERYLEYFDADQIYVLTTDELRDDRQATLRGVFDFLGVNSSFYSYEFEQVLYRADEKRRKTKLGYVLVRFAETVRSSRLRRYASPKLMLPVHAFNARTSRPIPRPKLDESLHRELVDFLRPDADSLRAFTGKSLANWLQKPS